MITRCEWAGSDSLMVAYHDHEWGMPVHDECTLFEFLILEGAQAGLSWMTILRKRENYRLAFDNFDPVRISLYDDNKIAELLSNPGIVRNKLKIASTIQNAQQFLAIQDEFGSFDAYIWGFVGGKPKRNAWQALSEIPAQSNESAVISADLKKRGFKFVGSTICYAFMQAVGLVNDHVVDCFRYSQV
ncbi:MAG: DNA-3-methyladenine glycosylase I [Anaerolineales bacterium]|nr:DNA-3-methyladenine glycosylase I [Anaerolineales bacterium]